jgi:hypothetical protein
VAEADLEVGKSVHHAAVDERPERDRPLDQVPDHVRQAVARGPGLHDRRGTLMEEDDGPELFDGRPEGAEARLVQGHTVDVVADRDAQEPQLVHRLLHHLDRGRNVLQRDRGEPSEARGVRPHHARQLVVALIRDHSGDRRVEVVLEEPRVHGEDVDVHPHPVHLADALLGRDGEPRDVELPDAGVQGVPGSLALDRLDEPAGCDMVVDVDDGHVRQNSNCTRAVISFCVTEATRSEAAFITGWAK